MGPGSCTAATASSRRVQRAITRPDRSSRGLFMRVRRRSGQLYCRQRHHCVATNPPQHRTIACTRDTYRSLQTFSTLLGSRNLQSTLVHVLPMLLLLLLLLLLSSASFSSLRQIPQSMQSGVLHMQRTLAAQNLPAPGLMVPFCMNRDSEPCY